MKISYWGNYKTIKNSKYIKDIVYFVFEENKCSEELINYANKNKIKYYIINSKKDMLDIIKKEELPDITIVGSFGKIFTREMIELLSMKIINIHPGILPNVKGRHPLPQTILNKEKEMGITAHVLNECIDSGKIVDLIKLNIDYKKSYKYNETKLLEKIPIIFDNVIDKFLNNNIDFSKEILSYGTYYPPLSYDMINKIININRLEELFIDEKSSD